MTGTATTETFEREDLQSRALLRELHAPRPAIYWTDLLLSAGAGWTAFGFAATLPVSPLQVSCGCAAIIGLYRSLCFLHEIAHIKGRTLPGFEIAWNVLVGFPLLMPSFIYVGVHQAHHHASSYGTAGDPEYLPFARSRPMTVLFALESFLIPAALMVRFLLLAPVGLLVPRFQKWLTVHASALAMNFKYRREITPALSKKIRRGTLSLLPMWTSAIAFFPRRVFYTWFAVVSLASFINTLRTLGAHRYESHGRPLDRGAQLRDSIDVPGNGATALWAPVGLRFHALHHYFPGLPYHNLGAAHRRLTAQLPPDSVYRGQSSSGLLSSLRVLLSRR